ncbi:hypothetical protein [Geofilum rhodophaeum]|uniref:hypothetical protein n=1 Tax=Geofilum rhodophaeum TaxID=1965019 RepID=UPI000B5286FA|nr:hypothetical protein [Geofilum rhodophaeum]
MIESTLTLDFHQRRLLTSSSKTYYYIAGFIEIAIGVFGLIKSVDDLQALFFILLIGGITSISLALNGKSLIKERNFISIDSDIIEFKNSFKRPRKLQLTNLLDVRNHSKKIEFVTTDQHVKTYDFSIFSDGEIQQLLDRIEKIKSRINE